MGYTTEYQGQLELNTPLQPKIYQFLKLFSHTRRMARNVDEAYGEEGEFYVFGKGICGQDHEENIIDFNTPPKTQPTLWCDFEPNEEGTAIQWNGKEKTYGDVEWISYLIKKILAPNGYVLNGEIEYQGEDTEDYGTIKVVDNEVVKYTKNEIEDKRNCSTQLSDNEKVLYITENGKELKP